MLNNSNSNNKGCGKVDKKEKELLVNVFLSKKPVDKKCTNWGKDYVIPRKTQTKQNPCGKQQDIPKKIHNAYKEENKFHPQIFHRLSTLTQNSHI